MSTITKLCPMCGNLSRLELNEDEARAYSTYYRGRDLIQNKLPSLNRVERELLLTGYCPECQKILFGNGETERIQVEGKNGF